MPCVWPRRSVLVALMAGSVTALSGCRIRLEDDAPRIPGLPTRDPMADERALLSARRDSLRLQEIAEGMGASSTPLTRLLATLHSVQADVFESALRSGGVPLAQITATSPPPATAAAPTTTAGGATPAPAPSTGRGVAELAAAESERFAPRALSDLAGISSQRVALFASMTAQSAAAVRLLGGRLPPTRTLAGPTGDAAAGQLAAFRSAVYGFEVVVAQSDPAHRKAAARTLGVLRARSAELDRLAGSAASPIPLGYALPFRVTTPAAALRLASHLMAGLLEAVASRLEAATGDSAALTGTVHLLTDVTVDAVTWRVPLSAFPGLAST